MDTITQKNIVQLQNMKKILFVITKSNWGGAQRYVFDLATALHRPHAEFEVAVAFGQHGLLAKKLDTAGIKTYPILSLQRDVSLFADIKSFFELLRLFRKEKPDIVHLNSSKASGVGALAARIAGVKKIIFTAHGWPFAEKRNAMWRLFALLGSLATALFSHTVIVVSENDLSIGKRIPLCGAKMRLIYNGIDLRMQFGSGEKIRNAFPPEARIIGTVGELTKNKNQIALVEQARIDSDMFIAIVGEGEERQRLEAKIKEYGLENRVKLFGFIPAHEVLLGFDLFALPSLKEGLPYVLLEAKLAGLPFVFTNRVGGIGEILDAANVFSSEQMVQKTTALYLS